MCQSFVLLKGLHGYILRDPGNQDCWITRHIRHLRQSRLEIAHPQETKTNKHTYMRTYIRIYMHTCIYHAA